MLAQQRRDLQAPDRGRRLPQAAGRRAAAPAEEQDCRPSTRCCTRCCTTSRRSGPAIDPRLRALAATDDLIARVDSAGCDIRDLLISELGPYGHVRFTLNGDRLFLPPKLAVSLALMFHELATNAGKYGAFSSPRGLLQVSWTRQRRPSQHHLGRDRGPEGRQDRHSPASAPSC